MGKHTLLPVDRVVLALGMGEMGNGETHFAGGGAKRAGSGGNGIGGVGRRALLMMMESV